MSLVLEEWADQSVEDSAEAHDEPRARPRMRPEDRFDIVVSVVSGLAAAITLRTVFGWGGLMSAALWWYLVTMVMLWLVKREHDGQVVATDRLVSTIIWSFGLLAVGILGWMLVFVFIRGAGIVDVEFLTSDMSATGPLDDGGGVFHGIVGTVMQVGIATIFVVPVSILTAVFLHEIKGRGTGLIRFIVDAMSGLPSIVAGLLVFTLWVNALGRGFSGFAASLALTVLMIPTVTRTAEEILRTIPDNLREASLALGAPQWRVVAQIVLPTARAGLLTATILGIARAVGETAPVLLTAFGSSSTNWNVTDGPQANLAVVIFQFVRSGNERQVARAWGAALVLIVVVLVLFLSARIVSTRGERKLGRS